MSFMDRVPYFHILLKAYTTNLATFVILSTPCHHPCRAYNILVTEFTNPKNSSNDPPNLTFDTITITGMH